jgi:hypothetical protein
MAIPTPASIVPIFKLLSKSLIESIHFQRIKASRISMTIEVDKAVNYAPILTFGLLAVTYGVALYYIFPLALPLWDASLILSIFFLILVGMITGLSILVFNFQSSCEIGINYLLLFWKRTSIRNLLKKNLLAHL